MRIRLPTAAAWAPGLLPALLALLLYFPTLSYDFVWDDRYFIVNNRSIRSLANLPRFFYDSSTTSSYIHLNEIYRPLRNVTYTLDYAMGGGGPRTFHLTSILLHAINAWLVWRLAAGLLRGWRRRNSADAGANTGAGHWKSFLSRPEEFGAVIAGLFWAAHPLATEAAAWIKSRDDLLVAAFCIAGAGYAARWRGLRQPFRLRDFLIVEVLHAGALLSKETGVVFPGLIWLTALTAGAAAGDWMREDNAGPHLDDAEQSRLAERGQPCESVGSSSQNTTSKTNFARDKTNYSSASPIQPKWTSFLVFLGFQFFLTLLYLGYRSAVLGEIAQLERPLASGAALFWTQIRATAHGLRLAIWPAPLLADYQTFRISAGADAAGIAALAIVAGLLGASIRSFFAGRRWVWLFFATGWWMMGILPVSNLIPTMQFLAERFLYMPLAGACVAAGWIAALILKECLSENSSVLGKKTQTRGKGIPKAALALLLMGLAAFAWLAWRRIPAWKNNLSLYSSVHHASPTNTRAAANLAQTFFSLDRYKESLGILEELERLRPNHPTVLELKEDARFLAAHESEIAPLLEKVDREPSDIEARIQLGTLAWRARLPEMARRQFAEVLRCGGEQGACAWRALAGLAIVEARQGRAAAAREKFNLARSAAQPLIESGDHSASETLAETLRILRKGAFGSTPSEAQ